MRHFIELWQIRKRYVDNLFDLMDSTPKFGWVVGLLLMAVSFIPKFSHDLNSDSAVYLYLSGRILDGANYYTDFFEFNTPFAIGIYTIPVAVARMFDIFVPIAGKIFIGLLIIGSISLTSLIIRQSREWASYTKYNALIITLFFAFNFLSNFYENELTTKTIVFLCFIVPYFFSIQLRIENIALSRFLQIITGTLLGLALCLKPHYIFFPAVMEIYLAYKARNIATMFRWPNILAGAIALVYYVIIIPIYFPGYIKSIPFFFEYYDAAYFTSRQKASAIILYILYLLPLFLWQKMLKEQLDKLLSFRVFYLSIVSSMLILSAESLISSDQLSALNFFICIPFLYSILVVLRHTDVIATQISYKQKFFATFTVIIASVTIFGLVNIISAYKTEPRSREITANTMLEYVNKYAANEPIYTISDNTEHFTPLTMYLDKRSYPIFHLHRMLYNLEYKRHVYKNANLPERTKNAEIYFLQAIDSFFSKTPPKLVFTAANVAKDEQVFCQPLLLELLLRRDEKFKTLWENNYKKIGTINTGTEIRWLEDRPITREELKFGDEIFQVSFPPRNPITARVDVYIRKE